MNILDQFSNWMILNTTTLSDSSIYKYTRAVNTISKKMIEQNIISKSLFEMNLIELDIAIINIFKNQYFINKNKIGNKMYSNALKQFRYFTLATIENDSQEEIIAESIKQNESITETEKSAIIKARIGQGTFRKSLLDKYDGKCIVTHIDNLKLLIASHIKPWAICNNNDRVDVENGLLLSANFDRLFDSGLITFNNSGKINISSFVGKENERRLHISNDIIVDLKASKVLLENLEYHSDVLFVK